MQVSMDIGSWSGVESEPIEHETNVGGSTGGRLLRCLGISFDGTDGDELEIGDFSYRLNAAIEDWGPDVPGYPDEEHCRAYGRGPDYYLQWLEQLREDTVVPGLADGHRLIVWF